MNHKVLNIQNLYNSANDLYIKCVVDAECGADSILNKIYYGIEKMKDNWKGIDASIKIQEVINIYNKMILIRNKLAEIARTLTIVAIEYQEIQISNGERLNSLNKLNPDFKTELESYSDITNQVYIKKEVIVGKQKIDDSIFTIDIFRNNVQIKFNQIIENWVEGVGREQIIDIFNKFSNSIMLCRQSLIDVSNAITISLQNYNL